MVLDHTHPGNLTDLNFFYSGKSPDLLPVLITQLCLCITHVPGTGDDIYLSETFLSACVRLAELSRFDV